MRKHIKCKEAEAEAKALKLIREQLELNTQLIDYKAIEKWDGTVPKIVGSSGATLFDVTGIIGSD